MPFKSAVDVGCGVAPWLRVAVELGAARAVGIDGEYVDRNTLLVDPDKFRPCDLEAGNLLSVVETNAHFDLAICMEVSEHLSAARATSFVAELCQLSDLILFSAAVPGQGGTHHINEQWPSYWWALFKANGFDCFDVLRSRLWERDECEWWYLQNVLLYAKRDTAAWKAASRLETTGSLPPMSLVHPRVVPHIIKHSADRIIEQIAKHQPLGHAQDVKVLETKLDQLRLAGQSLEQQIRFLEAAVEQARLEMEAEKMETEHLSQSLAQSERDLRKMSTSSSWRITAPLRSIVKFFKLE